jgi:hypothetical protein
MIHFDEKKLIVRKTTHHAADSSTAASTLIDTLQWHMFTHSMNCVQTTQNRETVVRTVKHHQLEASFCVVFFLLSSFRSFLDALLFFGVFRSLVFV